MRVSLLVLLMLPPSKLPLETKLYFFCRNYHYHYYHQSIVIVMNISTASIILIIITMCYHRTTWTTEGEEHRNAVSKWPGLEMMRICCVSHSVTKYYYDKSINDERGKTGHKVVHLNNG